MPIAAFGVAAATVLGLGALAAADIESMDQIGHRPPPFGSQQWHSHDQFDGQFDGRFDEQFDGQFDGRFHQFGDRPPIGDHP